MICEFVLFKPNIKAPVQRALTAPDFQGVYVLLVLDRDASWGLVVDHNNHCCVPAVDGFADYAKTAAHAIGKDILDFRWYVKDAFGRFDLAVFSGGWPRFCPLRENGVKDSSGDALLVNLSRLGYQFGDAILDRMNGLLSLAAINR